jgi:hypothetical protein
MLFQMLTGKLPFTGSPSQVILRHLNEEPAAPSSIKTDLPAALDRIVLRSLAKAPADRYAEIGELRAELAAYGRIGTSETVAPAARPASIPPTVLQPGSRETKKEPASPPAATPQASASPVQPAVTTAPVTRPVRRRGLPVGAWIGIIAGGVFTLLVVLAIIGAIAGDKSDTKATGDTADVAKPGKKRADDVPTLSWDKSASLARLAAPDADLVVLVRPKRLLEIRGFHRFINNRLTVEIRQLFAALNTGPDRLDEVLTVVPRLPEAAWEGKNADPEFLIAARELDADAAVRWFRAEHKRNTTEEKIGGLTLHRAAGTCLVAIDPQTLVGGHTPVVKSGLRAARSPRGASLALQPAGLGLLVIRLPSKVQPRIRQTFGLGPDASIEEMRASLTHESGFVQLLLAASTDSGATARKVASWLRRGLRHQRKRASRSQRELLRRVTIRKERTSVHLMLTGQGNRLLEALQFAIQPRMPDTYPMPRRRY